MTLASRISSNQLAAGLAALLLLPSAHAATLITQVELVDSREPSVQRQKDFSNVALWLERIGPPAPMPAPRTFTMVQKSKKFTPHVLAIPLGSAVDFPNFDPIFHNAFSNFSGQPFDTGLYAPGASKKIFFRRSGIVRVFCNIHSTMSAVILVMPTPYFALSKRSGELRIDNIEPGTYDLKLWHERAAEGALHTLERRIVIEGDVKLPLLRISESGYLEVPHKNKHDKDYPPSRPDHLIYPGGAR